MALKWLAAQAVQGSADAFAEAEFQTGLSNVTKTAYRIRRIEWILPAMPGVDCALDAVIRRNSAAAMAIGGLSNVLIAAKRRQVELVTSGMVMQELVIAEDYRKDMELLIVEESLFLDIDSTSTSAANTVSIRIGYETRTITENERLSIQAATANG
jgi:hypothetical protein